jgi:hypothetical protein
MENIWAVLMGRQFFCMSTVGPPNKNPCMSTSKNKDNNKSKQNYPNYQMQVMLLKPVLCFYNNNNNNNNNNKWSNHSKYNQLESSSVS